MGRILDWIRVGIWFVVEGMDLHKGDFGDEL
jgi:hypothetical protein